MTPPIATLFRFQNSHGMFFNRSGLWGMWGRLFWPELVASVVPGLREESADYCEQGWVKRDTYPDDIDVVEYELVEVRRTPLREFAKAEGL